MTPDPIGSTVRNGAAYRANSTMTEPLQTEPLDLATAGQRHAVVLDFAPLVLATPVLTAPLIDISIVLYVLLSVVVVALFLVWLRHRVTRVAVLIDAGQLSVTNVFRSYRLPIASMTRVVTRDVWLGSVYASCLGVHARTRVVRIPKRSIALHASASGGLQETELAQLLNARGHLSH